MKMMFVFMVLTLISCSEIGTSNGYNLTEINEDEVEIVEIKKNLYDTISVQLNKQEQAKFSEIVNNDSPAELGKAIPKYWIFIKYKNDSVQLYKILDTYIGERDVYIKTDNANYFRDLYKHGKKEKHKISIN
jgi:hypothetical protein